MKYYALLAAYLATQMANNMLIAWTVPGTRLYWMVRDGGNVATAAALVVSLLYVYVLFDIIVWATVWWKRTAIENSDAWGLASALLALDRWLARPRFYVWALLFLAHASQLYLAMRLRMPWLVSQVFLQAAVACAACATIELLQGNSVAEKAPDAGDRA